MGLKSKVNLCTQGDVQNPCRMRLVIPVYTEDGHKGNLKTEHLKICTSQLAINQGRVTCNQSPHDLDVTTRYAFCGEVR